MTKDQQSKGTQSKDRRSSRAYRKPTLVVYGDLAELTRTNPPGGGSPDGLVIGSTVYRTS